jgi:hypothetical protein
MGLLVQFHHGAVPFFIIHTSPLAWDMDFLASGSSSSHVFIYFFYQILQPLHTVLEAG